jgi:hypothetical protein
VSTHPKKTLCEYESTPTSPGAHYVLAVLQPRAAPVQRRAVNAQRQPDMPEEGTAEHLRTARCALERLEDGKEQGRFWVGVLTYS